jgi:hypothetical protein
MPRRRAEELFTAPEVADGVFPRLQPSVDPDWVDEALEATELRRALDQIQPPRGSEAPTRSCGRAGALGAARVARGDS